MWRLVAARHKSVLMLGSKCYFEMLENNVGQVFRIKWLPKVTYLYIHVNLSWSD